MLWAELHLFRFLLSNAIHGQWHQNVVLVRGIDSWVLHHIFWKRISDKALELFFGHTPHKNQYSRSLKYLYNNVIMLITDNIQDSSDTALQYSSVII